jgi:aryl-alcohol dehydrogenase-like predicted oxidoreductase
MAARGVRDQMVVATKYTSPFKISDKSVKIQANYAGNSAKSMRLSLENSLRRLKTDYVDIFYVHWWEYTASIEEIMLALNDMVKAGKVLYLGISDAPAWIVSKANQYARDHGLRQL